MRQSLFLLSFLFLTPLAFIFIFVIVIVIHSASIRQLLAIRIVRKHLLLLIGKGLHFMQVEESIAHILACLVDAFFFLFFLLCGLRSELLEPALFFGAQSSRLFLIVVIVVFVVVVAHVGHGPFHAFSNPTTFAVIIVIIVIVFLLLIKIRCRASFRHIIRFFAFINARSRASFRNFITARSIQNTNPLLPILVVITGGGCRFLGQLFNDPF
mmetsp:Transcript_43550/g.91476  ORF Transcript_43550/g.91476 Transcript_43550/m.91476 type:complete len:212 (+) Transcript_43550:1748-2383(+)